MEYAAVLTRDGANILVSFPDCPGCQTFAKTRAKALVNAREALEGWLAAYLVVGDAPPQPTRRRFTSSATKEVVTVHVPPILAVRLQLRWARQARGLSQADLARRVGVTRQQVALLESPDSNVTLRTLERVAQALNLRVAIQLLPDSAAA